MLPDTKDTIAAIATAAHGGAVGIVRVSGADAEAVLRACFAGLPAQARSHQLYYGRVVSPGDGEVLDEALAVLMRGPRSFTGEDVAEIQCHGGGRNLRRVLEATLAAGARAAQAGEFSLRAFLNGRIDLTRAEAIADIVAAETDEALRVAQAQLGGALEAPLGALRKQLLDLLTLLEATLDFAGEEHVYQLPGEEVLARIEEVDELLGRLLAGHAAGRLALGGTRLVLVGEPNVGKSSLFNRLVGLERAIVTEVPGTTRDVLEETTTLLGHRVHVVDTAGLRETVDVVERIGVERTEGQARDADLVVWVVSAMDVVGGEGTLAPPPAVARCEASRLLVVVNKIDVLDDAALAAARVAERGGIGGRDARGLGMLQRGEVAARLQARVGRTSNVPVITTSAQSREGLQALERALAEHLARLQARTAEDVPLVTSVRHAEALGLAREALGRAREAIESGMPLELASADVRDAADALGRVVGAITSDEVLAGIFSSFCVGK